jgi:hypothetical protein
MLNALIKEIHLDPFHWMQENRRYPGRSAAPVKSAWHCFLKG